MLKFLIKFRKLFAVIIVVMFFVFVLSRGYIYDRDELDYGVTFSVKQARDLGLEWREVYLSILNDLEVRKLRLSAYWDEIQPEDNVYNWEDLDWMVNEASARKAEIILAVGGRLPRWPECHFPGWVKELSEEERQEKTLNYIEKTIKRYENNDRIVAWQVENEPFLPHFGECPDIDKDFLDREIALVRELDQRPIIVSDSGELSLWVPAAKRANIFGTTMYRDTYSEFLESYVHYPIEPGFFRFKKNISRLFARPEKWIVIELQAEPWGPKPFQHLSKEERDKTMSLQKFKEIIEFSRKAGFREFYLWGVEWWYWEAVVNGDDSLWEEAKLLFIE